MISKSSKALWNYKKDLWKMIVKKERKNRKNHISTKKNQKTDKQNIYKILNQTYILNSSRKIYVSISNI